MYRRVRKDLIKRKANKLNEDSDESNRNEPKFSKYFHSNVPNLVNTSPSKIRQYKRLKMDNNDKRGESHIRHNHFLDEIGEPFNTVFVSRFGRHKPNREEVYKFFETFGKISTMITNSERKLCSYAFIRYESSTEAYNVCNNSNIKFTVNGIDCDVLVVPRLDLCANEGIENIACITPLDKSQIQTKLLKAESIDEQFLILQNEISLKTVDVNQRKQFITKLESILNENRLNCKLHIFGSTVNRIGFRDTDIDIFIEIAEENNLKVKIDFNKAMNLLKRIGRVLRNRLNMFIPQPIPSKRCPLLKLEFKHFSESLRSTGINCDLSLTNSLGIRNSKLIAFLCKSEPKFQTIAITLKYMAKVHGLIGSSKMSSYAFSMLIIFFCQKLDPPLLPSVDSIMSLSAYDKDLVINGIETVFCTDVDVCQMLRTAENELSNNQLIQSFFVFYADFEFHSRIICPRFGRGIIKEKFNQRSIRKTNDHSFNINSFMCIQDPFDMNLNLTANMRYHFFNRLIQFFKVGKNNLDLFFTEKSCDSDMSWGLTKLLEVEEESDDENDINHNEDDSDIIEIIEIKRNLVEDISDPYKCYDCVVGNVDFKCDSKLTESQLSQKLNEMTNAVSNRVHQLLSKSYQFFTLVDSKEEIKLYQKSNFVRLNCRFRRFHLQTIDIWDRDSAKMKLNLLNKNFSFLEKEDIITKKIMENKITDETNFTPSHITFVLSLDSTSSPYRVNFSIIEMKPNPYQGRNFIEFIKKNIILLLKTESMLVIDDDIIEILEI